MAPEVSCHHCGYDLRAHSQDGKCPECGASVAESWRWAAIPRRPAWRDSDLRWRRRMLGGIWIIVLLPLLNASTTLWHSSVPVPTVFDFRGSLTLADTFLTHTYEPVLFCMGTMLLFSKERGRRSGQSDWTRRWGVLCSSVVLLLCAAQILSLAALVVTGIAQLFLSMPPKYQPGVTQWFVDAGSFYLHYGPSPKSISAGVLAAFSSITILLACVPLFNALRSSGPKWVAVAVLAPLALFSAMHLVQAGRYSLAFIRGATWSGLGTAPFFEIYLRRVYFSPALLVGHFAGDEMSWIVPGSSFSGFVVELIKWSVVLTIAIWMSIAQLAAWWQRERASVQADGGQKRS